MHNVKNGGNEMNKALSQFAYYSDYLMKLGSFDLSKQITIADFGTSNEAKAVFQKCYRDMKKEKFKGTSIDYLCLISANYILYLWNKEIGNEFVGDSIIQLDDIDETNKQLMSLRLINLLIICNKNKELARNMVRLFNINPESIVFNEKVRLNLIFLENDQVFASIFSVMGILNYYEFMRERGVGDRSDSDNKLWKILFPSAVEKVVWRKDKGQWEELKEWLKSNKLIFD
jgi:hypothetical protein